MPSKARHDPRFDSSASEELGHEIAELCGYIDAALAHFLDLIREFDERRYWEEQGFRSCAHWLNFKCGLGMNAARERLRIAHALKTLPAISAAFTEGKVSFSKVRAMTRVATADSEEFLLMVAKHGTANHVERLVSQYRRVERLRHPDIAEELYLAREVTYYYDDDGSLVMKARMPADKGELIIKALEMAMEEHYVGARPAGDIGDPEPIAARRTDALCEIAETYLNHPDNSGSTADRYQVVVHVDAHPVDARRRQLTGDNPHLENGPHVSAETSRRIGCDCSKTVIKEDKYGEPLSIGRRSRTIPPPMRRALRARDGGCRFPGCTNHKFVDGHHIRHWADGGETSLENLILLCRHHHHLVHEGGFDCQRSKDGEIYFMDQRAQRLREFQTSKHRSVEESLAWLYRKFEDTGVYPEGTQFAETSAAKWYAGEEMDMEHAVWLLCQRSGERPLSPRADAQAGEIA